jgi:DNA-binding XRE family transcriptional regulator
LKKEDVTMPRNNRDGDRAAERASREKDWTGKGFRKVRALGKGGTAKLLADRRQVKTLTRGIVDRICEVRLSRRLSQAEVARRMGAPASVVARLETEPVNCTMETLLRYAKAVGASISVNDRGARHRRASSE